MLFFRSGILLASDTTILPNDWASMHRALWVNLPSSYKYSVGVVVQGHDNVIAAHIGKERNIIRQFQHFFHIAQAAARIEVKISGDVVDMLRDLVSQRKKRSHSTRPSPQENLFAQVSLILCI